MLHLQNVGNDLPLPFASQSKAPLAAFTIFVSSPLRSFPLHRSVKCITQKVGPRQWVNTGAALTTNHLPKKGDLWLTTSLSVPARNVQATLPVFLSTARSLRKLGLIRTLKLSRFCSKTRRCSTWPSIP